MVKPNEVTTQFATGAFIFAWLLVACIIQVVGVYNHTTDMKNQLAQSEAVIDGYVEELTENQSLLDTEIDKNAQLSATITELQTQLSDIENELAATQDKLTQTENEKTAFEEQHTDCRPPISYTSDNVLTASYVTGDELAAGLQGALKPYAWCFVEMEKEYGINAIFLSSVAALESGWCTTDNAIYKNNLFGFKNSSGDGFRTFPSKEDGIRTVAKFLKNNYLTEGGIYYNGLSVAGVNIKYCEQMDWAGKVDKIADGIINRIENV
jgi:beta-N-acetylglucosaminidase